ncbi:energy-coupling factor transporter transmembrane component T [Proteiniborus sp.]|uniref:energy-coupling factor transporter transmembrane component T family protein n=1 Tax=Proteiniborus sp. TaxID=2079015 RepID=UPI00331B2743
MINIDPRTKLIIVFLISAIAIIIDELLLLIVLLSLTFLICKVLSIDLLEVAKKLKKLWTFFFVLAFIQSIFTSGGEPVLAIGNIKILTTDGLVSGISVVIRMTIIICSALIIASSPIMKTIYGLIAMKLPYEIAFMVLIAIKFLPIFREEFLNSVIAVQLSGISLEKVPLKEKISIYKYILMPSIVKALDKARYISISMESRGFRAYECRTSYCKLQMRKIDYVLIFATTLIALMIILLQFNIIG